MYTSCMYIYHQVGNLLYAFSLNTKFLKLNRKAATGNWINSQRTKNNISFKSIHFTTKQFQYKITVSGGLTWIEVQVLVAINSEQFAKATNEIKTILDAFLPKLFLNKWCINFQVARKLSEKRQSAYLCSNLRKRIWFV